MGTGSQLGAGASQPAAAVSADPYVITIGASVGSNMPPVTPQGSIGQPHPRVHRRTMAERAAALQSRFDAHARLAANLSADAQDSAY